MALATQTEAVEATARPQRPAPRWIFGPVGDLLLAWCWVPFAIVAHLLVGDPIALGTFATAVFVLSLSHQPLTLALVYGDREQFRLKPAVFVAAPAVLVASVVVGYQVSFVLLAIVAGLWNAEHTLMQRYGLVRIYGRKAGEHAPTDGRLERWMLFSWLGAALLFAAVSPATRSHLDAFDIGRANRTGIETLLGFRTLALVLLVPLVPVAFGLVVAWVRRELRAGHRANPAKWNYVVATASLFVVIFVDPIAGLLAYIGSHAVEYFVMVHHRLALYADDDPVDGPEPTPLGRAVRARPGRLGFLVVYAALLAAMVYGLRAVASPLLYAAVFFTLGGLHILYDGFIWKLRRPSLARGLVG